MFFYFNFFFFLFILDKLTNLPLLVLFIILKLLHNIFMVPADQFCNFFIFQCCFYSLKTLKVIKPISLSRKTSLQPILKPLNSQTILSLQTSRHFIQMISLYLMNKVASFLASYIDVATVHQINLQILKNIYFYISIKYEVANNHMSRNV